MSKTQSDYSLAKEHNGILEISKEGFLNYFITGFNLAGTSIGVTPLITNKGGKSLMWIGSSNEPEPLIVTFQVSEYLDNYFDVYDWMLSANKMGSLDIGSYHEITKNASLTIFNNNNVPCAKIIYDNIWPYSLTSIEYNTGETNDLMTATVQFYFEDMTIERIKR
jgi:hypothetical protein